MSILLIVDGQKKIMSSAELKTLARQRKLSPASVLEVEGEMFIAALFAPLAKIFLAQDSLRQFPKHEPPESVQLESAEYVFIDLETPNYENDSICSLAVVFDNGESYQTLVNPGTFFSSQNTQVHGITKAMVEYSPDLSYVWQEVSDRIEGKVLVAYNAKFDLNVLVKALRAYGIEPPQFQYVDTLELARREVCAPKHSLDVVCNVLGIPLNHHNALSDALACREVFNRLGGRNEPVRIIHKQNDDFADSFATEWGTNRPVGGAEIGKNSVSVEKQALLGIIHAIQCHNIDSTHRALAAWQTRNKIVVNDELCIYKELAAQCIKMEFSSSSLDTIIKTAASDAIDFTLASFYYFVEALCACLPQSLDVIATFLSALPKKELPGNVKKLQATLKQAVETPASLPEAEYELQRFLHPFAKTITDVAEIQFCGKQFVLTGNFRLGKDETEKRIRKLGGDVRDSMTSKADYLVIGSPADAWKLGVLGGAKTQKALEWQDKGAPVQFILEETLLKVIE